MLSSISSTGRRDGDDDDENGTKDNPLQGTDTGVESGEYKHPVDLNIPGDPAEDNSQL